MVLSRKQLEILKRTVDPIKVTLYSGNDDKAIRYLESEGLVSRNVITVEITELGRRILQEHLDAEERVLSANKRYKINEFRAWITLAIAFIALVLSIIALANQMSI